MNGDWLKHIDRDRIKSEVHWGRYLRFIQSRPEGRVGYLEGHHKWPKSMGGLDDSYNIIKLTPREHFLAHLMLHIAIGGPMSTAYWLMCNQRGQRLNSRAYQSARQEVVVSYSKRMTENNPFRGKNHSEESISRISEFSKKQRESGSREVIARQVWKKKPEIWSLAKTTYESWIKYNKPGATRLAQLLDIGLTGMQLEYMVDRFKAASVWRGCKPWIPDEDEHWVKQFPNPPTIVVDEVKNKELIEILISGKKHSLSTRRKIASSNLNRRMI